MGTNTKYGKMSNEIETVIQKNLDEAFKVFFNRLEDSGYKMSDFSTENMQVSITNGKYCKGIFRNAVAQHMRWKHWLELDESRIPGCD